MLKELWARFEAAVQKDDAELRNAMHELIGEIKARIEHIEEQLGIIHVGAVAPVAEPVAAPVVEQPAAPIDVAPVEQPAAAPETAPVQEAPVAPTETVSVPDSNAFFSHVYVGMTTYCCRHPAEGDLRAPDSGAGCDPRPGPRLRRTCEKSREFCARTYENCGSANKLGTVLICSQGKRRFQELHYLREAALCRQTQRRFAIGRLDVHIGVRGDQGLHHIQVAIS